MKKFFVVAIAFGMFSFAACKKDYTCTCTYDFGGQTLTQKYEFKDVKKADAEDSCDAAEANLTSANCSLD